MSDEATVHGGDLAAASARFGEPADGWLDLSTGINPHPYPLPDLPRSAWTRLPQRDRENTLLDIARASYGVPSEAAIVAAPGTQALIQWLPQLCMRTSVAVVGPTYAEHARTWYDNGHAVHTIADLDALAEAFICVVVNPNNPNGRVIDPTVLLPIADRLTRRGGLLVVDEAFADTSPEMSIVPHAGRTGLLVLRSFGKFFGLAGLRLGFAIGDSDTIGRLSRKLGPWAVSGTAIEIGTAALGDQAWIATTRERLQIDSERLDRLLLKHGVHVTGGTSLFRLIRIAPARALYTYLAMRGILTRPFDDRPDWLRIGLPGTEREFDRLDHALAAFSHDGRS